MAATFEFVFVAPSWECVDSQLPSNGHWLQYNAHQGAAVINTDTPIAWVHMNGRPSYKYYRCGIVAGTNAVRFKHCRPKKAPQNDVLIRQVGSILALNVSVVPSADCNVTVELTMMSGRVVYAALWPATSTLKCLELRNDVETHLRQSEEISRQVTVALVMGTTTIRGNRILWRWKQYEKFRKQSAQYDKLKLVKRINAKTPMTQLKLTQYFRKVPSLPSTAVASPGSMI
jgi:hypothetical protein